jgi:hypothetical protein
MVKIFVKMLNEPAGDVSDSLMTEEPSINIPLYNEWVMDVTESPKIIFMPLVQETREILDDLAIVADCCPGTIAAILHGDGEEAADQWISENPDWLDKYSPTTTKTPNNDN